MRKIGYFLVLIFVIFSCGKANNFQKQKFTNLKLGSSFSEVEEQVQASTLASEIPEQQWGTDAFVVEAGEMNTDISETPSALQPDISVEALPVFERQKATEVPQKKLLSTEPIDTIFTISGDTILCKIKTVTDYKIKYSVKNDGYTTESSIPITAAIKYVRGTPEVSNGKPSRFNAASLAKITKILSLTTLAVGIALLIFFLLSFDFALVLFLVFFSLLIITAILFLQTIFKRKIEKLQEEDPIGNAKEIRKKKIFAILSILAPIALTVIGFGTYILIALL